MESNAPPPEGRPADLPGAALVEPSGIVVARCGSGGRGREPVGVGMEAGVEQGRRGSVRLLGVCRVDGLRAVGWVYP